MKRILIATDKPFAAAAVNGIRDIVEKSGNELVLLEKYTQKSELIEAVATVDAVIIRSDVIDAEVINAASKLKIIVRAGAGYDNVDLAAATQKGICVMNTPGQNSNAVAELVFGMMIYIARGCFNGKSGSELRGKKLGIHAYGNVGRYVAQIAKGFGMELYAFDPFVDAATMKNEGIIPVDSAEALYSMCEYISLHIPATSETKGSIDYNLLMKMPKGATLVNTARKEVINEQDLIKVFNERDDFKYVSDIAPDCAKEIAEKFDGKFYFTPKKMGAQTGEANVNAGLAAANQIVAFFNNGDVTYQVNK